MKPRLTNDEQKMRDTMLRHEFPFDEQAWKAMQALLRQNEQPPVPGPASARTGNRLKKGKWLLLLLLLLGGALGAVVWWQPLPRRGGGLPSTSSNDLDAGNPRSPARNKPGIKAEGIQPVDADNLYTTSARFNPSPKGEGGFPPLRAMTPGSETSSLQPNDGPLPSSKNKPDATNTGFPTQNNPDTREQAPFPMGGEPVPYVGREAGGGAVGLLPVVPWQFLPLPPVADSLIRPVQEQRRPPSRWQRAWVLGLSANTVDYAPLRVRPLPHIGQLLRYRINPRTSLQGELTLKMVSGYGLRAEFMDVVPTGSSQVILENNNLLYLELPIAVHRQYAPDKAWLLGLKPSWNATIFPRGSVSSANFNAPRRDYRTREGIRIFDLGLTLGWEWRYHPRWALDVRYNQGLFDLTVDSFFKNKDYHLNSDLQISLRHFIIRNKQTRSHEPKPLFPAPAGR